MKTQLSVASAHQVAALKLRDVRQRAGLSLRELARRAQTSHPTLLAYERGSKTPSVDTFLRIVRAAGFAADIELSTRIRVADGLERGEELKQALELAAMFPARPSRRLRFPPLDQLSQQRTK